MSRLDAYLDIINQAAEEHGVPPELLYGVLDQESRGNPNAVGLPTRWGRAQGMGQLLPSTARGLGVKDPFDPTHAIPGAARYLKEGLDATGGDPRGAAMYYHGGPNTEMWGRKTNRYGNEVVARAAAAAEKGVGMDASKSALDRLDKLEKLYLGKPDAADDAPPPADITVRPSNVPDPLARLDELAKTHGVSLDPPAEPPPKAVATEQWGIVPPAHEAALRGFIEGLPIVGPSINEGIAQAAGRARALTSGKPADEEIAALRSRNALMREQYPEGTAGGELAGGVHGILGAGLAAPQVMGATAVPALAARVGPVLARMLAGGTSMAAIGAADQAARGGDADAILKRGATDAAFGVGGPLAGEVVSSVARPVGTFLANNASPVTRSANRLLEMGGDAMAAIRDRLAASPHLSPMDVDPNFRQQAMRLAAQGGEPQQVLDAAIRARQSAAPGIASDAYNAALGAPVDVNAQLDLMKAVAKAKAAKGFGEALRDAKPGIDFDGIPDPFVRKITETWDKVIKPFPDKQALSQPQQLHLVQSELRREAEALGKSSVGSERLAASQVQDARQALINKIDEAAGGKYRPAQKQFAEERDIQEAFDKGQSVFSNATSNNENRPEFWRAWMKSATPDEVTALKQGVRVAANDAMSRTRFAAKAGSDLPEVPFNRAKLEAVLGKQETDKIVATMRDIRDMAETNTKVTQGSQTANKLMGDAGAQPRDVGSFWQNATPLSLAALAGGLGQTLHGPWAAAAGVGLPLAIGAARTGVQAAGRTRDLATNAVVARMLAGTGPEALNPIDNLLINRALASGRADRLGARSNMLLEAAGDATARARGGGR